MPNLEPSSPAAGHEEREALRRAAVRPMHAGGVVYWSVFGVLSAAVVAGAVAWIYQLRQGLGATGLNQNVTWGIYTVDLVTFIGLSYGGALVSAILRLTNAEWRTSITRIAEATALVTLVIGASFPIIHLGHPERVWMMVVHPRGSSPMVWDAFAVLTYLVATVIFFYLPSIPDAGIYARWSGLRVSRARRAVIRWISVGWRDLPAQQRVLRRALVIMSIVIIPIAVYVHSVLAWAFSVTSRPGWHSTIFAPYFVIAALYSGVALVILAASAYRSFYKLQAYITPRQLRNLAMLMLTLGLVYAYFTFAEMLTEGYARVEDGVSVLSMVLSGGYATAFWTWALGGLVLPILLIALPWTRNVVGITLASVLAIAGMWLKRLIIVVPAMEISLVSGDVVPYHPSWVELTITGAATAAIPLLLMILFRFVPVLPVAEMEEAAHAAHAAHAADEAAARAGRPAPGAAGAGAGGAA